MYHFVNDLLPNGCPPRNLQLYFFDTEHELENKLQGADRMDKDITDEFSIILRSDISMDQRTYNMPSASQVAAIWIEDNGDRLDGNRNIREHDRISLSLYAGADVHEYDEIKEYESARWVSPPEAAWRIYAFPISEVKPADVHLQVHLQNYQYIYFHGNDRSRKWIALPTASSGIAASILPGGRTAHSTFKIPIDGDDKYVCNIGKRTTEATLLKNVD
nr:ATP-dependent DNA helicase RRM3-like [Ipomoea batatas]